VSSNAQVRALVHARAAAHAMSDFVSAVPEFLDNGPVNYAMIGGRFLYKRLLRTHTFLFDDSHHELLQEHYVAWINAGRPQVWLDTGLVL
jgi:hypothetical protein